MRTEKFRCVVLILMFLAGAFCSAQQRPAPRSLGQAALAPPNFHVPLPGGARPRDAGLPTGPFNVNSSSREQVRSFYNAIYPTSENVPEDSTADVTSCYPGTNSVAFEKAVLRRINWFRAMDGMPANVTFDTAFNQLAQQMAVMISVNQALNHDPPTNWICYNANAASEAGGNQAEGVNGADAITDYIWEFGGSNSDVGHRRWILWPPQLVMGTGDVPGSGNLVPANLTWVFGGSSAEYPATRYPYCSWPPAGFIPYWVVFPYWSFSYPGADFSSASVTMASNGVPVSVGNYNNTDGYGDNTLCWVPMGVDTTSQSLPAFPFSGTDTVYSVTVSNVAIGGFESNFTYQVTLFDPAAAGTDYIAPVVTGPSQPVINASNVYSCAPINHPNVTSYEWVTSQLMAGNITENAGADLTNNGLVNFTFSTLFPVPPAYPLITNAPDGSGNFCFHLCDPDATSQILALNDALFPGSNTVLSFDSMLGYATATETATVQVSVNGGTSWLNLYALAGATNNNEVESSFHAHSFSLANYAGTPTLLRFNYEYSGGKYFPGQIANYLGWCLENIAISDTVLLSNAMTNIATTTNITSGDLSDDASNGLVNFTTSLWPSYPFITNAPAGSGNCFHLTHSDYTPQSLVLNEVLLPTASSTVSFDSLLGYATSDETARVQISTDGGTNWDDLFAESGCYDGSNDLVQCETSFTPHTFSLSAYAGMPARLRFYYDFCCDYDSFPGQSANYIGWCIENIEVTNCQRQVIQAVNSTNFAFTPSQPGVYLLQPMPVIFNQFPLYGGTFLQVTAVANAASSILLQQPVLANGQVQLNFTVTGAASTFTLLQASQLSGGWTTNAAATLTTNVPGSSYRFTTDESGATQFYRIQTP